MELTVLGSGTLFLTKKRFPSAFLLEADNRKILLDCGYGALVRLAEINVDCRNVDLVFLSHFHTDHAGDAFALVHSRFVGDIYDKSENRKLIFVGPRTTKERFLKWREVFWPEPKESYPVEFYEGELEYELGNLKIKTFPVVHVPWFDSIGIQVFVDGKKIVYPGDIGSSHDFGDIVNKAKNADLLIIESSYDRPTPNHFTCQQIEQIVKRANVGRVLIVHNQHTSKEEKRISIFIKKNPKFQLAEDKIVVKL